VRETRRKAPITTDPLPKTKQLISLTIFKRKHLSPPLSWNYFISCPRGVLAGLSVIY